LERKTGAKGNTFDIGNGKSEVKAKAKIGRKLHLQKITNKREKVHLERRGRFKGAKLEQTKLCKLITREQTEQRV